MSALTAPGSTLWLLGHELRLGWRGLWNRAKGKRRRVWLVVGVSFILLIAFALGIPVALFVRKLPVEASPLLDALIAVGLAVTGSLMVAQALNAATLVLYERRDLDLLLSSPLPARRILTVRALGIAVACVALFVTLASPFALSLAILGRPQWLAIYPVLASLALTATSLGLAICMALFALIGPRATRVSAQILAGVLGAAFFLTSQSGNFMSGGRGRAIWTWAQSSAHSGWFDAGQPGSWPARALLGEPLPLLALTVIGVGLFVLTVSLLGRRFATDAAAAAGVSTGRRRRAEASAPVSGFRDTGLFQVMLAKELRLLRRDPWLISQILLQTLYLIPLVFFIFKGAARHQEWIAAGAAAGVTFLTAQLVGNLAWITVSAEDAPDLLASSPVPRRLSDRAKVAAAITPVAAIMLLPLIGLAWLSPLAGLAALLGAGAAAVSSALVNIWWQRPGKRSDIRRARRSSWLVSLAETGLAFCWSATAALLAILQPLFLLPAIVGIGLVVLLRRRPPLS